MSTPLRIITAIICLVIAAFLFPGATAWTKEKKTEELQNTPPPEDTLIHIKQEALIGTDGKLIRMLDSLGLKNDLQAPLKFRNFITSLPIVRMSMGAGYFYNIRRASLLWAAGDCMVTGRREQVLQLLLTAIKSTGFIESRDKKEMTATCNYTLEENGLIYSLSFLKPEDILMDGRPVCKTKLLCRVEDSNVSSPQVLSRIITIFPFLKDRRIEDIFYREMASVDVEMVSMGGASARVCEWEAVFTPPEKAKKITLLAQMETMLEKMGYARDVTQEATETFVRKITGSSAYLNKVAGSEKVHIRVRPEN